MAGGRKMYVCTSPRLWFIGGIGMGCKGVEMKWGKTGCSGLTFVKRNTG